MKFVKEEAYDRKASPGITIGGVAAVLIASFLVKSMPLTLLKWLVIRVILFTSITMLRASGIFKKGGADEVKEESNSENPNPSV